MDHQEKNAKIEKLKDDLLQEEVIQYNQEAVLELIQEWCINISENIQLCRQMRTVDDIPPRGSDTAIVVGAAPELTDEEILALIDFEGDIIITNKNLKRFYDLGVVPDWCCMLDAHPISAPQFAWLNKEDPMLSNPSLSDRTLVAKNEMLKDVKYLVASVVHPVTLRHIAAFTDQVYMFNPISEDTGSAVRISKTWGWMNDLPEMEHGGSVGCLAVSLAKRLRYPLVGLLGYGLCDKPNPKWKIEDAKQREWIYYPDIDQVVGLPLNFKSYISYITFEAIDSESWSRFYNLTKSPVLTHSPHFLQSDLAPFLRNHRTIAQWIGENDGNKQFDHECLGPENPKDA